MRLLRDNVVIHTGKVSSLKRFKDDASEVKSGTECGIGIAGYNDVKPGDDRVLHHERYFYKITVCYCRTSQCFLSTGRMVLVRE